MMIHQYEDFEPAEEATLHDACYLYGDPEVVAEARKLEKEGFSTRGVIIISGDWRDGMYDQHFRVMKALREKVKEMILQEQLVAFGYDNDPLDGPKWLKPTIWRHAEIAFAKRKIKLGGSTGTAFSNIVVFSTQNRQETIVDRSAKPFKEAELRRAYRAYIDDLVEAGGHSNREDDIAAMKELLGNKVTHQAVYKLRRDYAPKAWQVSGRRKSGKK